MRILVVDDNNAFLNLMGDLLRAHSHEVLLAEDGKKATEVLKNQAVDLIISDVFMPALDGSSFHRHVRKRTESAHVPFIFISGFDDKHTHTLVLDSKIDFFIKKTAPIDRILKLIKSVEATL